MRLRNSSNTRFKSHEHCNKKAYIKALESTILLRRINGIFFKACSDSGKQNNSANYKLVIYKLKAFQISNHKK